MLDISHVVAALQARKGDWRQLAVASGVPYSTFQKIARGKVENPGIGTVNKIMVALETTAATEQAAA